MNIPTSPASKLEASSVMSAMSELADEFEAMRDLLMRLALEAREVKARHTANACEREASAFGTCAARLRERLELLARNA